MWCGTRTAEGREDAQAPQPRRADPAERVGAAARELAAEQLRAAYVDELLDVTELEAALARAYGARTTGDLDAALAVLPAWWLEARHEAERRARRDEARRAAHRSGVLTYAAVMALLVGIWAVTALGGGAGHPWFIWPLLGWGIPLLLGAPRRPGHTAARRPPFAHRVG